VYLLLGNVTRRENEKCQAKILGHATRFAALPLSRNTAYVCVCVFMQWKTCILEENQKIEDPELGQCVIRHPARTDSNSDSDSSC